MTQRHLVPASS
jgi:hypothetical protein